MGTEQKVKYNNNNNRGFGSTMVVSSKKKKKQGACSSRNNFLMVKIIIFAVSTCILIWQVKVCIARYLARETTTILSVNPTGDTTFISFTICPAFEAAYKDDVLRKYGTNRDEYKKGNYWVNATGANKTPAQIHEEVTYNLSEILVNVTINKATGEDVVVSNNDSALDSAVGVWKLKYHILYGKCYALRLDQQVTKQVVKEVNIYTKINVYIYLHHPGQFLDYNSMTKLYGQFGQSVFIDVAYEIITLTLQNDITLPCSNSLDLNFDDCMLTKAPEEVFNQVGCTVPYVPDLHPKCDRNNATAIKRVLDVYQSVAANGQKSMCQRPCSSIEVFTGLPYMGNYTGAAYVQIFLKSTTKVNTMVLDYTFVTMLAEIGGYTGLLLGVSLVNLTYIIEKMVQKFWRH